MLADLIRAGAGSVPADLVFRNAKVVDVFCHRIIECDAAVTNGVIVGLGSYHGKKEIDCTGKYLLPGLINSHLHIESSMLAPYEYARIALMKGVTTMIADPHEICNVCGEEGLKFMLASAKNQPVDIRFMLPSCVPATPYDHSGACFTAKDTEELLGKYPLHGLGEMMNVGGVLSCDEEVLRKLEASPFSDGHAPCVRGSALCGYISAGIRTDHESTTAEELLEKVSLGMYAEIREGTQSQDLEALIGGINPYTLRRILFCTDDRYLGDVVRDGSVSNCIRKAISLGVDPVSAITIGTLNAAECYHLDKKGAVAPGYRADLVLSEDLTLRHISSVYIGGVCCMQDGKILFDDRPAPPPESVLHTVSIAPVSADDFDLPFTPGMCVIRVKKGSLITEKSYPDTKDGLNLCAVVERHDASGEIGRCYVEGINIKNGAIAQTIGHDAHNITVLGSSPRDMALAVEALGKEGGMSVVRNGKVTAVMELPIGGLMSDLPAEELLAQHQKLLAEADKLDANPEVDPFMMLSFLSLPVIPEVKVNQGGLFDVTEGHYI